MYALFYLGKERKAQLLLLSSAKEFILNQIRCSTNLCDISSFLHKNEIVNKYLVQNLKVDDPEVYYFEETDQFFLVFSVSQTDFNSVERELDALILSWKPEA